MRLRNALAAALLLTTPALGATLSDILAEINSQLPSGSQITAAQLRGVLNDMAGYSASVGTTAVRLDHYGAVTNGMDISSLVNAAVTDLCGTGGTLSIPIGSFTAASVNVGQTCNGINIKGAGRHATTITAATATSTVFTFGNGGASSQFNNSISDLLISGHTTAGTPDASTGSLVVANGVFSFTMENVALWNFFNAFTVNDPSAIVNVSKVYAQNGVGNGPGFSINGGSDVFIDKTVISCGRTGGLGSLAGILLTNTGGTLMSNIDVISCGYGLLIQPGAGQSVNWLDVVNSQFDTAPNDAIYFFLNTSTSTVRGATFSNVWASSSDGRGVRALGTAGAVLDGIVFNGLRAVNNGTDGVAFDFGTNLAINDSMICGNSRTSVGASDGVEINNVSHVAIRNNRIGPCAGFGTSHRYGILTQPVGSDYLLLTGNDVQGNSTAAVNNLSTGTHNRIEQNAGYNPVGGASITVGASPYTYTASPVSETIYITGGTVSAVATGGGTVATASPSTIQLGPNETVTVTYSVAPTMRKSVH